MAYDPNQEPEEQPEGRGRSARKREVRAFDALASELVELAERRCKKLPVTEKLRRAVQVARETSSKAARKRHFKHLAGVLRDSELEVETIRNYLAGAAYVPVTGDESYRDLEALRAGLCDSGKFAATLDEVCRLMPHLDLALVTKLAKTLHKADNDKAYRLLFKELRRAADESALDET